MSNDLIYTENMTVGYHKKPLIEDICLHVRPGEIVTLIGPNGAGKSTILKTLTRQLELVGGTAYVKKKRLEKYNDREFAKQMAIVMTGQVRPELMTCEDVVSTGRYPYTGQLGILGSEDKKKVYEALEKVHAIDLAHRGFLQISDGQRQRIMLARALCQEPEIIVLDEPTSFLDIRHKLELLSILKEMACKEQIAIVMSLHELDLAQKISDYVVCVNGRHIEKYGTPEEIFVPDYIEALYQVEHGSYNALFGCIEPEAVREDPHVFVIAGNGSGIPVYRQLVRQKTAFATGILMENDVDYQVADVLAGSVISVPAFSKVTKEVYEKALLVLQTCEKVFCPLHSDAEWNEANRRLEQYAREQNLLQSEN